MNAETTLFVYGTLRRDPSHELFHLLARNAEFLGEAVVQGKLYDLGDYPGMLYPARGHVVGELYRIAPGSWQSVVERLDEYEGCRLVDPEPHEYRRVIVDARSTSGHPVRAWAYVLARPVNNLPEIESGDYLSRREKVST